MEGDFDARSRPSRNPFFFCVDKGSSRDVFQTWLPLEPAHFLQVGTAGHSSPCSRSNVAVHCPSLAIPVPGSLPLAVESPESNESFPRVNEDGQIDR